MRNKLFIGIILSIFFISFISATSLAGYNYLEPGEKVMEGENYSINVNNSNYLQGYTPTTLKDWIQGLFDSVYVKITDVVGMVGNWSADKVDYMLISDWNATNYSYVPYTGANQNVNLGNNNLLIDDFSISCPSGMAYIDKLGGYCIDKYEASTPGCEIVGNNCASAQASYCTACTPSAGVFGSSGSSTGTTVLAYSNQNVAPLVRVSQYQAIQMCANAGKHLCTSPEWLGASNIQGNVYNLPSDLYVPPYYCVTNSPTYCNYAGNSNKACNTSKYSGGTSGCSSFEDVYDMTGNVWEWTNEVISVTNPGSGANWYYINSTDLTWSTSSAADNGKYGKDGVYFPANATNIAVPRGGRWDTGANAGPFSAFLSYDPSSVYSSFGFRCCSGTS